MNEQIEKKTISLRELVEIPPISDEEIKEYMDALSIRKDTNDELEGEGDELDICIAGAEQLLARK